MAKPLPTDLPYHSFATLREFDGFLEEHGSTLPAFYLKIAKKASGIESISADEAIEVGLCHGWIDGWGRSIDDDWHMKRYTPRRPKSIWSRKNIATVARLVEEGRMRPAGLVEAQAAQKDGRWDRAYGTAANSKTPDDLAMSIAQNEAASTFFSGLDDAGRYSFVWRVQAADGVARAAVIDALVESLAKGEMPDSSSQYKSQETEKTGRSAEAECSKKRARVREPSDDIRRSSRTKKK